MDLLQRVRKGDGGAFDELVDRYTQSLYRTALSLVGTAADAEDVVQETLLGAFKGARSFRGRSSVKTWLFSILMRQAARCRRTMARRKTVHLHEVAEAADGLSVHSGAGAHAARTRQKLDVLAVLARLSPEHREVVLLREWEGMSYEEMADVLGVPRGTVESRLYRARQNLKAELAGYTA
jgi:RNA polymerase sigma-70 factor (ECF subfamily)